MTASSHRLRSRRSVLGSLGIIAGATALSSMNQAQAATKPGLPWGPWVPIDGAAEGGIGSYCGNGLPVCLAVRSARDNTLMFRQNAANPARWLPWNGTDQRIVGAPALASWGEQRVEFAVLSDEGLLLHRTWTPSQGWLAPWFQLPALPGASSPTLCAWGKNRLDVFVTDSNADLRHCSWTGSWDKTWHNLGGQHVGAPASTTWSAGRVDILTRSPNGSLQHKYFDGATWSGWNNIGGNATSSPTLSSRAPGIVDAFTTGSSAQTGRTDAVFHRTYEKGAWGPWNDLDGSTPFAPATCAWGPMGLAVFLVDASGRLAHRSFG